MAAKRRRPRGDGSVYLKQLPTGGAVWVAEVGYPGPPARRVRRQAPTKAAAEAIRRALVAERDAGETALSPTLTVGAFLAQWLAATAPPAVAASTAARRATVVRLYLTPGLGAHKLATLTAADVQAWLTTLAARPDVGAATVVQARAMLRTALGAALRWDLVRRNVAALTTPPPVPRHTATVLTPPQARALLAAASSPREAAIVAVALYAGLRQGEILGLRWADVDLEAGRLHVTGSLERGTRARKAPKTTAGERTIPLVPALREALAAHLAARRAAARGPLRLVDTTSPDPASVLPAALAAHLRVTAVGCWEWDGPLYGARGVPTCAVWIAGVRITSPARAALLLTAPAPVTYARAVPLCHNRRCCRPHPEHCVWSTHSHAPPAVPITPEGYVFVGQGAKPLGARRLSRAWGALLTRANLPPMHFHDLRHTCLTWLAEAGVPLPVVQALAGHASSSTTAGYYIHIPTTEQIAAMQAIAQLLADEA